MAQNYRIAKISEQPPKEWDNPKGGTVYYVKVMLDGHGKPVEVGKKSPNALKIGDTIYGDIVPTDRDTDKFRAALQSSGGVTGGSGGERSEDIRAQMAIKAAVQALPQAQVTGSNNAYETAAFELACSFYDMVDRVKNRAKEQPSIQDRQATVGTYDQDQISPEEIPF